MPAKNAAAAVRMNGTVSPLPLAVVSVVQKRSVARSVARWLADNALGLVSTALSLGSGAAAWLAGAADAVAGDPAAFALAASAAFLAGVAACFLVWPLRRAMAVSRRRSELSRVLPSLSARQHEMLRRLVDGEAVAVGAFDGEALALVRLGLAEQPPLGFELPHGGRLTLGLRYAAELRGDPGRWLGEG